MGFRNPITTATDPLAEQQAQQAQTTANNALAVANAKNTIYLAATAPAAPSGGFTNGDQWIDTTNGNRLNIWTGTAWTVQQWSTQAIAAAAITAGQIAAGAIDGSTITGAILRTAASGQRIQLDSTNGLQAINGAGTAVTKIDPTTGRLTATGSITTASDAVTPGTVKLYASTTGTGNSTQSVGVVEFADGFSADVVAQLIQHAEINPRSNTSALSGGVTLKGGTYGSYAAPNLDLKTVQNGDGSFSKLASITGADSFSYPGAPAKGSPNVTFDSTGTGLIPHGLGVVPTVAIVTPSLGYSGNWFLTRVTARDATNLTVELQQNGTPVAGTVRCDWIAYA